MKIDGFFLFVQMIFVIKREFLDGFMLNLRMRKLLDYCFTGDSYHMNRLMKLHMTDLLGADKT